MPTWCTGQGEEAGAWAARGLSPSQLGLFLPRPQGLLWALVRFGSLCAVQTLFLAENIELKE